MAEQVDTSVADGAPAAKTTEAVSNTAFYSETPDDWPNIFVMALREMWAVCTLLIVLSRLGAVSSMAGASVLFAVFTVYGFPIMNPYLYLALSWGPFLGIKNMADARAQLHDARAHAGNKIGEAKAAAARKMGKTYTHTAVTVSNAIIARPYITWFLMPGFQFIGAAIAGALRLQLDKVYGTESLTAGYGDGQANLILTSPANLTNTLLANGNICNAAAAYPYHVHNACSFEASDATWGALVFAEEASAVFALCMGVFYIMFGNIYKEDWSATKAADAFAGLEVNEKLFRFMAIAMLQMGIYSAFPTADGGMHVSVYRAVLTQDSSLTTETLIRLAGGILGMGVVIAWYHIVTRFVITKTGRTGMFQQIHDNPQLLRSRYYARV